jgi:SAM-dependent methyltransferase
MADLKPCDTLLDIGCGKGDTIAILAKEYGLICTGIDRETEWDNAVTAAAGPQSTSKSQWIPGQARNDNAFDAVLFECVLSTLDDKAASVRAASKLLKDGGHLIIADLCDRNGVTPPGVIDAPGLEAACRTNGLVPAGWQDRTADLDAFAAEVIFGYGSFDAYFDAVCNASKSLDTDAPGALSTFCRLDPSGPPPGYFLAVYEKSTESTV